MEPVSPPTGLQLADFDFELPEGQIAQAPVEPRDASRLLTLDRTRGHVGHHAFRALVDFLRPGDLLVVNDARVMPARLLGTKEGTGGRAELLLVHPAGMTALAALEGAPEAVEWVCLGQASKGFKRGQRVAFRSGLVAEVQEVLGGGELRVRFEASGEASLATLLESAGRLPLPPYIKREPTGEDAERYQTVYARAPGSVAAPTAGLHFTPDLLAALEQKGITRAEVTLDVGPGTFLPVRENDLSLHTMHAERFTIPAETTEKVRAVRAAKGRVVAVGTTVVRTLEAATDPKTFELRAGPGETSIFITPGFAFRQVNALVTNFHLPRSTLLMLVSAFAGREPTLAAYREAVTRGYRFFSYGDAMFIA